MRRRTSKILHLGIVLALAASLSMAAAETSEPKTGLGNGDLAPAFSLKTLDGKTLTRDGLKGKVVLLDFWATWCGPCRMALPELKDLQAKNAGKPLVIVSVSVDDTSKVVEEFTRSNGMSWPQAWDGGMQVTGGVFRVNTFPSYVVIGADGRIAYRQHGWSPGRSAALLDGAVSKALAAMGKKTSQGSVNTKR
jgi:cytochrome c biogenesis protein CcmG, thiol:disulfide interchange protein DsbE